MPTPSRTSAILTAQPFITAIMSSSPTSAISNRARVRTLSQTQPIYRFCKAVLSFRVFLYIVALVGTSIVLYFPKGYSHNPLNGPPNKHPVSSSRSTTNTKADASVLAQPNMSDSNFSTAAFRSKVESAVEFPTFCKSHIYRQDILLFVDKHAVKQFVSTVLPSVKLAKEYDHVDKSEHITPALIEKLPANYIMKATHLNAMGGVMSIDNNTVNCLWEAVAVCTLQNEGESTVEYLRRMCGLFLSKNNNQTRTFGKSAYARVTPRCMFEEQLPLYASDFYDYKINMYHGKPMFIDVSSFGFTTNPLRNFRTPDWRELRETKVDIWGKTLDAKNDALGDRPMFLDEMLDKAVALYEAVEKKAGAKFPYIRVDFLVLGTSYYFVEFTFHPDGCKNYFPRGSIANKFYGFVATHPDLDIPSSAIHALNHMATS